MTPTVQSSLFNLRVPLRDRSDVFLMNTLTDAQIIVSSDVAALLDRANTSEGVPLDEFAGDELETLDTLRDNGFIVADRHAERQEVDRFFTRVKSDTAE